MRLHPNGPAHTTATLVLLTSVLALGSLLLSTGEAVSTKRGRRTVRESPHKKLNRTCEKCHLPTTFKDIRFDHFETNFALEGHHAESSCLVCHNIEDFSKVDAECAACHEDAHRDRLGVDCQKCHTDRGWNDLDASDIHERTNFPLLGRHLMIDCEACHSGGSSADFRSTRTRCIDCHQTDYSTVRSPDHRSSGFSKECQECHEMTRWTPSHMPDHDIMFPIFSGTHNRQWAECATCHTSPGNQRAFSCFGCHEHAQTVTDPVHQGISGYTYSSQDCYSCHPTGRAERFGDHDAEFFPIYSGKHNNQWGFCTDCHTNRSNRKVYSCVDCHEHAQATMDRTHQGIGGYSHSSPSCLGCHPTGQKGTFVDHDPDFFPIFSGAHRGKWSSCETCHTNPSNRGVFTCFNCHEHRKTKMNDKHRNRRNYSYDSNRCYDCHPRGRG